MKNIVWQLVPLSKEYGRLENEKKLQDIRMEIRILSSLNHPGIVALLNVFTDDDGNLTSYMLYLLFSVIDLLECPAFSPYPFTARFGEGRCFTAIARSLSLQALIALAYLHENRIAYHNVKPESFLVTSDDYIMVIDFGIVYQEGEPDSKDIWPEPRDELYFEVSTGAYRVPELIFGTCTYHPFVIDLWSFGVTLVSSFAPLRPASTDDGMDENPNQDTHELFIIPSHLKPGAPGTHWSRLTLYKPPLTRIKTHIP